MPVRCLQFFFFFFCQTRISRYGNERAWRSEIAPIGRKPRVGSDTSKRTLFKATWTEASSLKLHKTCTWPGSEQRDKPGRPRTERAEPGGDSSRRQPHLQDAGRHCNKSVRPAALGAQSRAARSGFGAGSGVRPQLRGLQAVSTPRLLCWPRDGAARGHLGAGSTSGRSTPGTLERDRCKRPGQGGQGYAAVSGHAIPKPSEREDASLAPRRGLGPGPGPARATQGAPPGWRARTASSPASLPRRSGDPN